MRFRVMLYTEKQKHKFVREYNLMIGLVIQGFWSSQLCQYDCIRDKVTTDRGSMVYNRVTNLEN